MLRVYTRYATYRQLCWTTALILAITVLSDTIAAFQGRNILNHALVFDRFVPYLGYYMLGLCLRDVQPTWRLCLAALITFAGAVALAVIATRFLLPRLGMDHGGFYFYDQLSPIRPVAAAAVFLLAKPIAAYLSPLTRPLALLAGLTLGVYLVHPVLMDVLAWAGLYVTTPNVWLGLPLRFAAVYAGSVLIVWCLRRLPGFHYILG